MLKMKSVSIQPAILKGNLAVRRRRRNEKRFIRGSARWLTGTDNQSSAKTPVELLENRHAISRYKSGDIMDVSINLELVIEEMLSC